MKKVQLLLLMLMACSAVGMAQIKKPTIIVFPAVDWCTKHGYMKNSEMPDYRRALNENSDMGIIIDAVEEFMQKQNYRVKNLRMTLESIARDEEYDNARGGIEVNVEDELTQEDLPDIKVTVGFEVKQERGYKFIEFRVSAYDVCTKATISAGNSGAGSLASGTSLVNQLNEAVLSFKDKFINDMDTYYARMLESGRQIKLTLLVAEGCGKNYNTKDASGNRISELIDEWIAENSVNGNYNRLPKPSSTKIVYSDICIPLKYIDSKGHERGANADWFGGRLAEYIKSVVGVSCMIEGGSIASTTLILGAE